VRHILYRTENVLNGKYYVGMHTSRKIDDGYLGSGKILLSALKKHGRESFTRTILAECESRAELAALEKQVVNAEMIADPLNMNLKLGGEGGGCIGSGCGRKKGSTHTPEARLKISAAGRGRKMAPLSNERKRAIGDQHRGLKHTPEAKAMIGLKSSISKAEEWKVQIGNRDLVVSNLKRFCKDKDLKYTTLLLAAAKGRPTRCGVSITRIS
jgi:hypothetical protein